MGRGVISNQDYRLLEQGYLVDNISWQGELKRRAEEQVRRQSAVSLPGGEPANFTSLMELPPVEGADLEGDAAGKFEAAQTLEEASRILKEAQARAAEEIERARLQAEELLSRAKEEAERQTETFKTVSREEGKKEGLAEGYQEGLGKGKSEGLESVSALIRKWTELLDNTASERKRLLMGMSPILSDLAAQALHQILKNEARQNKEMVVVLVEETLKKAHDRSRLIIHLNPMDCEEVSSQKEKLRLSVGAGELEIMPDGRIEQGGCLLETEAGSVDARLSTIAAQVKQALNHA